MNRNLAACFALFGLAACGGKTGTLSLDVVVSPTDDPFSTASSVRFTIGDSTHITTVPVTGGHFSLDYKSKPESQAGPVLVEALDANNNVIAHGITPSLSLTATDQGPIAVWVGRPGKLANAAANLSQQITMTDGTTAAVSYPLAEMASTMITGLGVLMAGGRDMTGAAVATASVYDVYTQGIINASNMEMARAGAVAMPVVDPQAAVYGGATSTGAGTTGTPQTTIEYFDPTSNLGAWNDLPSDAFDARSFPSVTVLGSGQPFISGGLDLNGMPLNSAAYVAPTGVIRLYAYAATMQAARAYHAVAPATFSDGAGAVIFGGLPVGGSGPVAERLVGANFATLDVGGAANRRHATASLMPSGNVVILGGETDSGVEDSAILITPSATPPTVTQMPGVLSSPRSQHTASVSGNDLVVCGGVSDSANSVVGTCDVLDISNDNLTLKSTLPMATPRRGQVSETLETGDVVIAGGRGSDGNPVASIEIFTHE